MVQPNPLTDLRQTIRDHWLTYRPQMCADLEAEGLFDDAIDRATRLTQEAVDVLVGQGESLWDAWIAVREEWAILPAEDEDKDVATEYPDLFLGPVDDDEDEMLTGAAVVEIMEDSE